MHAWLAKDLFYGQEWAVGERNKGEEKGSAIISSTCHIVLTTHGHHSQDFPKEVFNRFESHLFRISSKASQGRSQVNGCVRFQGLKEVRR